MSLSFQLLQNYIQFGDLDSLHAGHEQIVEPIISELLSSNNEEIRANAARVVGSAQLINLSNELVGLLNDTSPRVSSLASISLGRIGQNETNDIVQDIFNAVKKNRGLSFDPVLRHSFISSLDRLVTVEDLIKFGQSESVEQRLIAVILLRKRADSNLMNFLEDKEKIVRLEAIRAIYDTAALDGLAGQKLALVKPDDYSYFIQSRIVGANFRIGTDESAKRLLGFCSNPKVDSDVKTFILHGLQVGDGTRYRPGSWTLPTDANYCIFDDIFNECYWR